MVTELAILLDDIGDIGSRDAIVECILKIVRRIEIFHLLACIPYRPCITMHALAIAGFCGHMVDLTRTSDRTTQ